MMKCGRLVAGLPVETAAALVIKPAAIEMDLLLLWSFTAVKLEKLLKEVKEKLEKVFDKTS